MKILFIFSFLLSSHLLSAADVNLKIINQIKHDKFLLGIGSQVQINNTESIFVGRMIGHEELGGEILFMNPKSGKISMVDSENLKSPIPKSKMQSLISTVDQAGETCAAYGIYHFWKQIHLMGYKGSEEFQKIFSQEKERMKLLETSIIEYYLSKTYRIKSVLGKMGKRFAFNCRERVFDQSSKAIDFVYSIAVKGNPVVMEFNIGSEMEETENDLVDFETNLETESWLWGPRKIGVRNKGGHVVVAAAAFTHKNQKKLMVLDSNWNEPRVWDMERFLSGKTAIKEMIFHVCNPKGL